MNKAQCHPSYSLDGVLFHILKKLILISFLKQQINILMHAQYILYIHSYYWFSCYKMADAPILTLFDLLHYLCFHVQTLILHLRLGNTATQRLSKLCASWTFIQTTCTAAMSSLHLQATMLMPALSKRWPPSYCNSHKS